jgi:hypothetical protein
VHPRQFGLVLFVCETLTVSCAPALVAVGWSPVAGISSMRILVLRAGGSADEYRAGIERDAAQYIIKLPKAARTLVNAARSN